MISQEYYDIIQQPHRTTSIRLFLLNQTFKKVGSLEGVATSGNISISATSDIRRSCNISLVIKNSSFLVDYDKKIWMDKYVKIETGIKNNRTKEMVWINQGIYLINQPHISFSDSDRTLSFTGVDLMAKLTGSRDGQLGVKTIIPAGTPITQAIRTTVKTLGKFDNLIIEETNRIVPYDIEKSATDSIYSLLVDLRDLYMDYEIFFDVDGTFHYQKIKSKIYDPVIIDFTQLKTKLILEPNIDYDFENVKNKIIIWGWTNDNTGEQIYYTKSNTDVNSKFNVNSSIGEIIYTVQDDKIQTLEQAQTWADYYIWQHNNLCEKINLSAVPIPWLDINQKIVYASSKIELDKTELVITDLTIPLDITESMTINTIKVY